MKQRTMTSLFFCIKVSFIKTILFSLIFTINTSAQTQGTLDLSFNPADSIPNLGSGANSVVHSIVVQTDGKILIGGSFTTYRGIPAKYIARLNTDGTLDNTFNAGNTGANNGVFSIALQSDGKILIGGNLTTYNGTTVNRITRLNIDGSLDTSFNTGGAGTDSTVYVITIQSDDKILIGGSFISYNGSTANYITRLNTTGTLDTTFNTGGTGADYLVNSIALQSDGKILIGGYFVTYNGGSVQHIARLNINGTLDTTFNTGGVGPNLDIFSITVQSDDKILIGGAFNTYNGTTAKYIARLNTNGTLDNTFTSGSSYYVYSIALQSDNKIVIGGAFMTYNGTTAKYIVRVNTDGTLDNTFTLAPGADYSVNTIALQSDNKILIGGNFSSYNSTTANRIARLNTNGTLDNTLDLQLGANSTVYSTVVQPDGKILIGGLFTTYNGSPANYIARLNTNGTLDNTFNTGGTGANSVVRQIILQPDGKILIAGNFTTYNGTTINRIARLNTNGTLDNTFTTAGGGANNIVYSIALQADSKILIGGNFTTYNGTTSGRIARLNINGTKDNTFNTGSGFDVPVMTIAIQPNGKILAGGLFNTFNSTFEPFLARLNTNGSVDTTFNTVGVGVNNYVYSIALQSDGKILIGGSFHLYNSTATNQIARLNTDGSLDSTFSSGTGTGGINSPAINSIALQSDGKMMIGGGFTSYNGTTANRIARLNTDGSLDNTFNTGTGANNTVWSITVQSDNQILMSGVFSSYNGKGKNRIARLANSCNPNNLITNIVSQDTICSGTSTAIGLQSSVPSNYSWTIGQITGNITGANSEANDSIIQELILPHDTANGTVAYIITPIAIANGCIGVTDTITVNVVHGVWAGDANHDYVVNNYDLLQLGLYYGQTGTPRASISNAWQAYIAANWDTLQNNGQDLKHADCNGDGTINSADTLAIMQNYTLQHNISVYNNNWNIDRTNTPNIHITVQGNTFVTPGDSITAEVWVGSQTEPVDNLYGIAFAVHYDASLVQSGTTQIVYTNSWLGNPTTNAIKISHTSETANTVYGAISRIDHSNASGFGKIAELKFKLRNDINSISTLPLSIVNAIGDVATGDTVQFAAYGQDSVVITPITTGIAQQKANAFNISIAPNPFTSQTTITLNQTVKNGNVKVMDMVGREVKTLTFKDNQIVLEKGELNAGVYFIQISAEQIVVATKRIVIQ